MQQTCSLHLVAVAILPVTAAAQRPLIPLETHWPVRTAVGMSGLSQMAPATIEARSDGWVVFTPMSTRPDDGTENPTVRLIVRATDVRKWANQIHARLAGDTMPLWPTPYITLGRGRLAIEVRVPSPQERMSGGLWIRGCGPGSGGSNPPRQEIALFADAMLEAARLAGSGLARPPTLDRPYYASEVSCPAVPDSANPAPVFPMSIVGRARRATTVGVRFVVDTAGRIEAGSFDVLPNTDARFARAVRNAVARWRFQPAEWDGLPVRQIVQTRVLIDPRAQRTDTAAHSVTFWGEPDGWIGMEYTFRFGTTRSTREWFRRDDFVKWLDAYTGLEVDSGEVLRNVRPGYGGVGVSIGSSAGIRYFAGIIRAHDSTLVPAGGITMCAGAGTGTAAELDARSLAQARQAAETARAFRAVPANPANRVHDAADVGCAAWLPWSRALHRQFRNTWQYPLMPYPKSMAPWNALADVLASFVVDTAGVPDVSTLEVMARSDPRAVDALRESLGSLRFRPATRGGVRVPQRLVRVMLFEAPVVCLSDDAGPQCTRRYGPGLGG